MFSNLRRQFLRHCDIICNKIFALFSTGNELVKKLKLHHFDSNGDAILKKFPSRREKSCVCEPYCELFSAAAANDINKLSRLQENKADFFVTDYFGHTTLHIAAAKGALEAFRFIADNYPSLIPLKDKWGRTAKAYATELKFYEIIAYIEQAETLQ